MHENKTFFLFFYVFTKTRYFNTGFVSLQYKNTNQYWSKCNKKYATIFQKYFFEFFLGWAGTARPSKQKQTVENSPLFTYNVNSGAARARKKKKKRSGGLPGGRPFLRELELPILCCWTVVLFLLCSVFFLCSFFSPLLSPVSLFLLLLLMVVMSLLMVA